MSFFIYENWRAGTHKAVLHRDDCGYCKFGAGLSGGTNPRNGSWHGPYISLSVATRAQQQLPVNLRKPCPCIGREA